MKILLLDQFSEPGGAQFCLRDLMVEIVSRRWQATLMVPGDGALVRWARELNIRAVALPLRSCSNGRKTPRDFLRFCVDVPRMMSTLRSKRADMIYVNGPRVLPAAVGADCPIVFHAHSRVQAGYQRGLVGWLLRSTNAKVIAASRFVADDLESSNVVYNGVADFWRGQRTFERKKARVGIIGRIAPEKGQLDFVRAAVELARGGEAEFFVHGETLFSGTAYEAKVRAMAHGTHASFCGWTDDVALALRNLDILAVPSGPDEAATRVIMEAFSAGTPVVAYRAGGIPELVEHGRTGLLTDTADAGSLARSIEVLLRDRRLMERLSAEGRSEWDRRFRIERFQSTVCDLLERWAQNARHTRREEWEQARAGDETGALP